MIGGSIPSGWAIGRGRWQYRHTVLSLCTLAFFVTMVGRLAISPVVPEIIDEFAVSNTVIGLALSGMWLSYGLTQFPSGVLAGRYGERRVILVAIGGTAVTSLLIATAPVLPVFFLGTIFLGGVAGLHFSVATTLLSRTYADAGTAIGIHNNGGTVAGLVAPVVVSWIAVAYGWRPAVLLVTVIGLPAFLLFSWGMRPTEPRRPDGAIRDRLSPSFVTEILTRPSLVFSLFVATAANFTWQGTASFLPTFLIEYQSFSTTQAGILFSLYFVVQAVGQVVVGAATVRVGHDRAIAACLGISTVGFAALVTAPDVSVVVLGIVLLGIGMSYGPPVILRLLAQLSEDERTSGFGLSRTVYMTVAASGPVTIGLAADLLGWGVAFSVLGLVSLAVVGFLGANRALGFEY